jgi:hypothetical protein
MFTLALFLALSTKPTLVCVGFIDARCDVIYASLEKALTDGPDQSIVVAARTEHVWPTLTVIDRSFRYENPLLLRQLAEMQQRLMNAAKAAIFRREYGDKFYPNGCSPKPLCPGGCALPSLVVQL